MKRSRWLSILAALAMALATGTAVFAFSYQVQRGDTLSSISRRFSVSVETIRQANGIANPNLIYAGQTLEIPDGDAPPPATPTPPPAPPPSGSATYTVQPGDTLSAVARRFGATYTAIAQANGIANPNFIRVGQVLIIPGGSDTPPPPSGGSSFELGGQAAGFGRQAQMQQAGMKWIKIQHKWRAGDAPGDLTAVINEAHDKGFKILLSISGGDTYPGPGSIDFNAYVNFVKGVAALGPDAIEIWNEMNIDFEWPAGEISPSAYVNNMLAPAYRAIKAVNGSVMVISGAPAPTGFDNGTNAWADDRYLAGMRDAGAASYADCIGVHHNAGATSPYAASGHPAGTHYSWYFGATRDLYYNTFGGRRPLCFTELGYLSGDGFPGLPPNFAWAGDTSVAEQAQWLAEAAALARSGGNARLLIIFNVDLTHYDLNGDPQAGYAIIRPDGGCPACESLQSVMGGG